VAALASMYAPPSPLGARPDHRIIDPASKVNFQSQPSTPLPPMEAGSGHTKTQRLNEHVRCMSAVASTKSVASAAGTSPRDSSSSPGGRAAGSTSLRRSDSSGDNMSSPTDCPSDSSSSPASPLGAVKPSGHAGASSHVHTGVSSGHAGVSDTPAARDQARDRAASVASLAASVASLASVKGVNKIIPRRKVPLPLAKPRPESGLDCLICATFTRSTRSSRAARCHPLAVLHATHYTLYLTHYTPHTIPYTLHTTHYTLYPIPYTLYPIPYTLHTTHYTPHTIPEAPQRMWHI